MERKQHRNPEVAGAQQKKGFFIRHRGLIAGIALIGGMLGSAAIFDSKMAKYTRDTQALTTLNSITASEDEKVEAVKTLLTSELPKSREMGVKYLITELNNATREYLNALQNCTCNPQQ